MPDDQTHQPRETLTRRTIAALSLLCALLAIVVAGARYLIERDRERLAEKFAADRLLQVEEAADLSRRDLDGVAVVLRLAGTLIEGAARTEDLERELRALLAASDQFRAVAVYGPDGRPELAISNPRSALEVGEPAVEAQMREAAARSLSRAGELELSSPLSTAAGRSLRVVAISLETSGRPRAVAMLLDSERLLSKLRLLASDPALRLLLLGPHGRPASSSDPVIAAASTGTGAPPMVTLLKRLRAGERGTLWMRSADAAALEMGDADVVCAFAPVQTDGLGHWSLALLTSTSVLRSAERSLTERLVAAAAAIGLLLIAFGVFVVEAARRSAVTQERLLHAERLARLHERTEKTLDNIPAGVMSLTADLCVSSANRMLRQRLPPMTFPCSLQQALPEAPAAVLERLKGLVDAAASLQVVQSVHGEHLALFGSEGQYSIYAVPLGTAFDEARTLLVFEDVSEVRSLESQLLRAEKLATIGVLAAGLAHEIGTPLGIVRARAEYVLGKIGHEHSQGRGVAVIIDQVDRVTRTIRQMLDFSRVRPAVVKPVALTEVATWLSEVLRYEAQRRKVSLKVDVAEELPLVSADSDQLQQLLLNLVMNACDACAEGGHVTVTASVSSGAWRSMRLQVVDDGCGIPEDQREGVFDPFFTTKKGGQGTGLGLTVAAQIVRNHGGQIELDSEVGMGTRVTVLWPLAQPSEQAGTHAA